jgi:hypothetical protein
LQKTKHSRSPEDRDFTLACRAGAGNRPPVGALLES